jgi:hypothetical protein
MKSEQKKILKVPLRLSISILIIGMLFKIMHWPYGAEIVACAFGAIIIVYPFRFWNKKPKFVIDYVKLILLISWALNGIFTILHLPYKIYLSAVASISLIVWLVMEASRYFRKGVKEESKSSSPISSYGVLSVSGILIFIGVLFKIMHWPGAGPLLILGLSTVAIWFVVDLIINKE